MSTVDTDAPRDYARLINKTDPEGYAFWTPYTEGVIGDCGIVRPDGQFVKLFNLFAEGTGFECLPTAEPEPTHVPTAADLSGWPTPADGAERRVRNENNITIWRAQESKDWSVEVEAPVPIPVGELGFGFTLTASNGLAAFLAPCGPIRRVETYLKDRVFPEYLKRNSRAIRARYSGMYEMGTIYILEGTTHTASWCRGFTRQHGRSIHGFISVDPIPGVPIFRVECSHGQMINHPWMIAAGPSEQPPDGTLHLIRARLTIRHSKRPKWLRDWFGQQVNAADNASLGAAGGGSRVATVHTGGLTPSTGPAGQIVPTGLAVDDRHLESFESLDTMTPSDSAAETPSSGSESSSDEPEMYAPNEIQTLLDFVFEAHPQYDSLIVKWSVLQSFWDLYGNNPIYDRQLLKFYLEGFTDGEGRVAVVKRIVLQTLAQANDSSEGATSLICPLDQCLHTFGRTIELKEHLNTHLVCHWYLCPFCPKAFLWLDNGLMHIEQCSSRLLDASDELREMFDARYPLLRLWSPGMGLPRFKADESRDAEMVVREYPRQVWECARNSREVTYRL